MYNLQYHMYMETEPFPAIEIRRATAADAHFAREISLETASSAIVRGTGISSRTVEFIIAKMDEGKAVIAVTIDGRWAGFSYIECWSNGKFVSNSGLIVAPAFRKAGIARAIKQEIFELSRELYPEAKIFSIMTGLAIMRLNMELGFEPVTFDEIARDKSFWKGCSSCVNYAILQSKGCRNCLCTAMLYDPERKAPTY